MKKELILIEANLNGNCIIGNNCFISSGIAIKQSIKIEKSSIITAKDLFKKT